MTKKTNYLNEIIDKLKQLRNIYAELSPNSEIEKEIVERKIKLIDRFLSPLSQGELKIIWYLSNGALSRPLIENPYPNKTIFNEEQQLDSEIFDISREYIKKYGEPS